MRLLELNYHHHEEFNDAGSIIEKHRPSNLILEQLQDDIDLTLVKHTTFESIVREGKITYCFFKGSSSFYQLPSKAHGFTKEQNPDFILVQGFAFPLQVLMLRRKVGNNCRIFIQHQGDMPGGKKVWLQRLADGAVNGYFFRAKENAGPWLQHRVIRNSNKIYEVPDASTGFSRLDKAYAKEMTGVCGDPSFLWVGRLDANKDPMTVLRAFESYFSLHNGARLYMISQGGILEDAVLQRINEAEKLRDHVFYVGRIDHSCMATWYSAADYFVSASHHEGGSYALTEAMACGCIPIVSAIPPSLKATGDGDAGYSFVPGDSGSLFEVLSTLNREETNSLSRAVEDHFYSNLSPNAAAKQLFGILESFYSK